MVEEKLIDMLNLRLELLKECPYDVISSDVDDFRAYIVVDFRSRDVLDKIRELEGDILNNYPTQTTVEVVLHDEWESVYTDCLQDSGNLDLLKLDILGEIKELEDIIK